MRRACLVGQRRERAIQMKTPAVTREVLLASAYAIADAHGVAALSIRGLAKECGVSVGTIYNYFQDKGELTTATTALFFKRAFYNDFCHPPTGERYLDFCERMFTSMKNAISTFKVRWLKGVDALPSAERAAAHFCEAKQIDHVLHSLIAVYEHDARITSDLPSAFDAQTVSRFTLFNVLEALKGDEPDCAVLFGLLERTLYERQSPIV